MEIHTRDGITVQWYLDRSWHVCEEVFDMVPGAIAEFEKLQKQGNVVRTAYVEKKFRVFYMSHEEYKNVTKGISVGRAESVPDDNSRS